MRRAVALPQIGRAVGLPGFPGMLKAMPAPRMIELPPIPTMAPVGLATKLRANVGLSRYTEESEDSYDLDYSYNSDVDF